MAKTYVGNDGYRHYANSGKSVHRAVGRKKLGGTIYKGYDIHHKNENKLDNRPSNLRAVRHARHASHHAKKSGWW